jgi:hypothetical protein
VLTGINLSHKNFAVEYNLDPTVIVKAWSETMGEHTESVPMDPNGLNHFFLFTYKVFGKNSEFQKNIDQAGKENNDAIKNIKSALRSLILVVLYERPVSKEFCPDAGFP